MYTLSELENRRTRRISSVNRLHKEEFSQYLTPIEIASFMAKITTKYCMIKDTIDILDPGAGSGILSCSLISELKSKNRKININVDAYEIDNSILNELEASFQIIKKYTNISYNISNKNFISDVGSDILWGINKHYDMIIMNPPYKKIGTHSEYRNVLHDIGVETVNTYSAFMAIAIKLLSENSILTAIVPRSFCNGLYFLPFRKYINNNTAIQHIHIFESRKDNFKDENVLQENIVIVLKKTKIKPKKITLSYSKGKDLSSFCEQEVSANLIINAADNQRFISIPGYNQSAESVPLIYSNKEIGFEISTGPIVDFRMKDKLAYDVNKGDIPLLYTVHIRNQKLTWPVISKKPNVIILNETEKVKYCFKKGFYILIKRFSSKEERHRIQATLISPNDISSEYFTVENHLNIIHCNKGGLDKDLAFALAAYLNSDYCDNIFRKFSGHTQINATDLRNMKYPNLERFKNWSE
ncbi:MAG: Eco57I restriction-modification methylase domain-containing protein [Treponema sp.]|jgi:adenine-specific DNA-methyltransferase|nr:Eco57I restriction-modification methylase domain-containing protein [Treponema sp.]